MKRWLDGILCGLSLLLCATAVVFWIRSYRHWDSLTLMNGKNRGMQIETSPELLDSGLIWATNAPPTTPGV